VVIAEIFVTRPCPQVSWQKNWMLVAFNKPFGVLSQFTKEQPGQKTLATFKLPPRVYPVGRLDADSEGLLLLCDEPGFNHALLQPRHGHRRRYWVQVERVPSEEDLGRLKKGVAIQGYQTLPCAAWALEPQPEVPPRDPPVRSRKAIPTFWIALELVEGKNRQVRRMTAAIGFPTLRLIRVQVGALELGTLAPGQWKVLSAAERQLIFK
jgi:23S rRNA pseudouridine2457 synthase